MKDIRATTDPGGAAGSLRCHRGVRPASPSRARRSSDDGDWHLAFFCWIVRAAGGDSPSAEVVLQKRAAQKDVWPGELSDASAAGHVRFGESMAEAAREIEDQLGLKVDVPGPRAG